MVCFGEPILFVLLRPCCDVLDALYDILGGAAANSTMKEAKERGATDGQAIALGITSGIAESLFEKFSIEKLLSYGEQRTLRSVLKSALTQSFTEASEEFNTTIANTLADAIIMADKNAINMSAKSYEESGYGKKEAKRKATLDAIKNLGLDALGGAISGGFMGGITSAGNYIKGKFGTRLPSQNTEQTSVADTNTSYAARAVLEAVNGQKNTATSPGKVVADTSLFERGILKNLNQARKNLIEFAKKNFPASVVNQETGKEIGIGRTGLDKFLSGNIRFEKYASGFHIPELIENAIKVGEASNYHGNVPGIPSYEYFDSPINIDGTDYTAHIRVRNTNMGDKYYGHTVSVVDNIEIEPPTRTSSANTQSVQPVNIGDSISENSIPQSASENNRNSAQTPVVNPVQETDSVGAAEAGYDPFSRLQEQSSTFLPINEQAAQAAQERFGRAPVEVPTGNQYGRRISKTASTFLNSPNTDNATARSIEQKIAENGFSYIPLTDETVFQTARNRIQNNGYDRALATFYERAGTGRSAKENNALGITLYNEAVAAGDAETALDILDSLQSTVRDSARALQVMNAINNLTPAGKLYMINKTVQNMNDAAVEGRNQNQVNRTAKNIGRDVTSSVMDQNIPVQEWWMEAADQLIRAVDRQQQVSPSQKTTMQQILADLKQFAYQSAAGRLQRSGNARTDLQRVTDYLNNQAFYHDVWQDAQQLLEEKYAGNESAIAQYRNWLNSSIEDSINKRLKKRLGKVIWISFGPPLRPEVSAIKRFGTA